MPIRSMLSIVTNRVSQSFQFERKAKQRAGCRRAPVRVVPSTKTFTQMGVTSTTGSRGVNDDVEALTGSRRDEIAREQVVVRFGHLERVNATRIPLPKPLLADGVGNIKQMKLVGHISLSNQRTHPVAIADGVCREIQHNRKALPQDIDKVRCHRGPKPRRTTSVVFDGFQLAGKQTRRPVIFTDEHGRRARGEASCKCRLPGGNPSAEKIQNWCVGFVHAQSVAWIDPCDFPSGSRRAVLAMMVWTASLKRHLVPKRGRSVRADVHHVRWAKVGSLQSLSSAAARWFRPVYR